jgi:hypothetical protein
VEMKPKRGWQENEEEEERHKFGEQMEMIV